MKLRDYFIALLITTVVTIIGGPIVAGGTNLQSGEWWWTLIVTGLLTLLFTLFIYDKLLEVPRRQPEVPASVAAFTDQLRTARRSFRAVSSKELALWESPTFLFYLVVNGVKNLVEYSRSLRGPLVELSKESTHKRHFVNRAKKLAADISEGREPEHFYGIRLLIYPRSTYAQRSAMFNSLIQIHALNRVYCLPLVREQVIARLRDNHQKFERDTIKDLVENLHQKPYDTEAPVTRAQSIWRALFGGKHDEIEIPDFLLVDSGQVNGDKTGLDTTVWWYEGERPEHKSYQESPEMCRQAERAFRTLCATVPHALWDGFSDTTIEMLTVGEAGDFFSKGFFDKWVAAGESEGDFRDWFRGELELLRREVPKDARVLDVGCGFGRHMEFLIDACQAAWVAGVDTSATMVTKAKENLVRSRRYAGKVDIALEDATNLVSHPDDAYDMVICMTNTFGNIPTYKQLDVLREMCRVAKPRGQVLVSVYRDTAEVLARRRASYEHVGLELIDDPENRTVLATVEGLVSEQFDEQKLLRLVRSAGLEPRQPEYVGRLGLAVIGTKSGVPPPAAREGTQETAPTQGSS